MMNHARVKALKGDGKTTSKKAIKSGRASAGLTPRGSPFASLLTSPAHSAAPSRVASDESEDDFEYDDTMSIASGSSLVDTNEDGTNTFDAKQFMEELQDRKHNNSDARTQLLELYIKVLRHRFAPATHEWLDESANELAELFIRGANRGMEARERLLYLQAYLLTLSSSEDANVYEHAEGTLKQIIADDDDEECKAFGIYALCFTVLYGGGGETEALELLDYLYAIVESDGDNIDSYDNGFIVAAALRGWAFVASHVDDFSYAATMALDGFYEQLDSVDVGVQAQAAACIALIFEAARNHEEETGESWDLPVNPEKLTGRMSELAKQSSKSVSKKDRRDLRDSLMSAITSLEKGVGPGYSSAGYTPQKGDKRPTSKPNEDGVIEFGYRHKLRLGNYVAVIDSWSLSSRIDMMRLLFGGHLQKHIFDNPVVAECLSDADFSDQGPVAKKSPKK
ncbi:interferon-related developmental regulator-domain-containing protein [Fusarium sp. MPI-SDFR-AT-0072]|uniref:Interferon-related developmental regulator N-terminal domain-containing protein n=1 Tax=Fusarium oxysporum f. sp. rapae TaxID=485398 RepID=A0A8J5P840_FUSOX|nr:Uncharacterized protein Forpe1208_v007858 [Fusarium oxysporum f. sp. rapae]KAH7164621.1 interferon-related developmental regulator-domain-containing protein [Fusarium sp. MPI-SDFR-AT-0072]KAI7770057.1 hypothetical protein LZL87_003547 [Fusarium oxysporum]